MIDPSRHRFTREEELMRGSRHRLAAAPPLLVLSLVVAVPLTGFFTLAAVLAFRTIDAAAAATDQASQIYVVGLTGGTPTRVAGESDRAFWGPSWSPDGHQLAFSVFGVGQAAAQLVVANADGSGMHQLTRDTRNNYLASWSPDGARLVFICQHASDVTTAEICRVDADGTDEVQLTTNNAQEYGASWSPDGKRIVFGSKRDGTWQLYTMNADGSDPRLLPGTGGGNAPAWSPDGKRIAFKSDRNGNDNIYVVNADGSNLRRLTADPFIDNNPAWSPDGKRIVFTSNRDGKNDVFVMDADGSNPINLTREAPLVAGVPAWSPDEQRIAFHAADGGIVARWRPRVLRGLVLIAHAALIVALLLAIALRVGWALGRVTLIAVVAGALLAFLLENPTLLVVVPVAGIAADGLSWFLRPSPARPRALRAAAFLVPLVLYGIPVLVLSRVQPEGFPLPYSIVLTALIGLTGLAVSYVVPLSPGVASAFANHSGPHADAT